MIKIYRAYSTRLIIFGFFSLISSLAIALDTAQEEKMCSEIGFKKKTEPFANCVLELVDRKTAMPIANNPDDSACKKYGFRPNTSEFSACLLRINEARQESERQQAQYIQQQKQYKDQLDREEKQRKVAGGIALIQMGNGIATGVYNAGNGYGTLPNPQRENKTIILPNGQGMNCVTTQNTINCY